MNDEETFEFLKLVNKNNSGGCWLWVGPKRAQYGGWTFNKRTKYAHRAAWQLFCGCIPHSLWVLHKCDNKFCVNPKHLFLGTQCDNIADMVSKGRNSWSPKGNPSSLKHDGWAEFWAGKIRSNKLTPKQVEEIRASYVPRLVTRKDLAIKYGVSVSAISKIIDGLSWYRPLTDSDAD